LPDGLRPLASIRGPELAEQIRIVNKESQNLHAEMLLRRLGLYVFNDASVESSLRARELFLRRMGVRAEGTAMYDGSGLSRSGLVTARAEVDLLAAMARHPLAGAFRASLPIAGIDGSLKRRMNGTAAEARVFAKTGSIRHVNALAGYVDSRSGRHLVFAIIVNHHTRPSKEVTEAMDAICVLLAELR
jgi:D-alanyl-D-alanine carboxypeptidase/D-alanyl-D-alanine-endopeptidase (penicillin-binding protein 4)